jgi:hypothetical protein
LDQQKKYSEGLEQANRAVELTQEGTDLGRMARNERDRLVVQAGGSGGSAVAPSAKQTAPQNDAPSNQASPNQASPNPASAPAH